MAVNASSEAGLPRPDCLVSLEDITISFPLDRYHNRQSWVKDEGPLTGGRITQDATGRRRVIALSNVSLKLESGARLGILGHNGAGKSTLLRTIMGIYPPAAGIVRVNGRIASMLDIHTGFDNDTTGIENIRLRAMFMGIDRDLLDERLDDVAAFTELGEYLHLPISIYSSGMRARLAFAIATGFAPEIVVMDEWLSAGDRDFRVKADKRMAQFVAQSEILIIASHTDALLKKNCNRAIVLEAGKIIYDGDVDGAIALRNAQVKSK